MRRCSLVLRVLHLDRDTRSWLLPFYSARGRGCRQRRGRRAGRLVRMRIPIGRTHLPRDCGRNLALHQIEKRTERCLSRQSLGDEGLDLKWDTSLWTCGGLRCVRSPRLAKSIYAPMEIHQAIDLSDGYYPRDAERMIASLALIAKCRTTRHSLRCNCKPFASYCSFYEKQLVDIFRNDRQAMPAFTD